ncbi:MAG: hypothetical protein QG670_1958 [Thermoproteota archaeon]|nr:hypothetical protein [Thermoproteota archaeon]
MALTYTLGLKRGESLIIRKTRRLPLPGEVLVNKGDKVSYNTEVARLNTPGKFKIIQASDILETKPDFTHLEPYMLKKVGDHVEKGEIIAQRKTLFGLLNKVCIAPTSGTIEHVSDLFYLAGQVMIREPPIPRSVYSYISGTVVDVIPKEGAIIETCGAYIQGIFGVGGEQHGEINVLVDSPDDVLTADIIGNDCRGKILVGGSKIDEEALHRAVDVGVNGIVVGGIKDKDITDFLGYEIGVAITGQEEIGLTLIVTEGFGMMRMANKTFQLLKRFEGKLACINGTTQIRAGVIRPEIIIPREDLNPSVVKKTEKESEVPTEGIRLGVLVRIVVPPNFGALGKVTRIPIELQKTEIESEVRVLEVELEDERRVTVPRTNVELIEDFS